MAHSDALRRAAELRQTAEESRSKAASKAGELAKLQQELDDLNREASQNEAAAAAALAAAGGSPARPDEPMFVGGVGAAPRGPTASGATSAPSRSWFWSDGSPTWLGLLALVLAALALTLSIVALNSGYLDRKGVTDLMNGAVLPVARDAADAKSTANRAATLGEQNAKTLTDHGVRLDAAEGRLQDLSACDPCKRKAAAPKAPAKPHRRPVKPAQAPLAPVPIPDSRPPSTGGTVTRPDRVWGFFQYDSSAANPKPCYFTAQVKGQVPRCSAYEVVEPLQGESEADWTARIARQILGMKGFETKHIGKTFTP